MKKKQTENPNRTTIKTPKGTLSWPHLTEPDYGTDDIPKLDGEYSTVLLLDKSDKRVEAFVNRLDEMMQVSKELAEEKFKELPIKARKNIEKTGGIQALLPYGDVFDPETEEPTGQIEFRAKMKAGGVRKKDNKPWKAKPALFDAKCQPFPKECEIWGGSTAVLSCTLEPYFIAGTGQYGLLRRLNGVQILELVKAGGHRTAESLGFEEQEGFTAAEVEEPDAEEVIDDSEDDADF